MDPHFIKHLLVVLGEECAEVAQITSKAYRFGITHTRPGEEITNAEKIVEEFNDIMAMMMLLEKNGVFKDSKYSDGIIKPELMQQKQEKVLKFYKEFKKLW